MSIVELVAKAHGQSSKSGFWNHDDGCLMAARTGQAPLGCKCTNRDLFMKSALIHSELSEALEEYRLGEKKHGGPFRAVLYDCEIDESFRGFKSDPISSIRVKEDVSEHAHDTPDVWPDRVKEYNHNLYPTCPRYNGKPHKPVGFLIELADVAVRIFDFTGFLDAGPALAVGYEATARSLKSRSHPDGELAQSSFGKLLWAAHGMACAIVEADSSTEEQITACSTLLALVDFIAVRFGGDLWQAIDIKMAYNATRPFKHGKTC